MSRNCFTGSFCNFYCRPSHGRPIEHGRFISLGEFGPRPVGYECNLNSFKKFKNLQQKIGNILKVSHVNLAFHPLSPIPFSEKDFMVLKFFKPANAKLYAPRFTYNNVMNVSDMMISFRSCLFRLSSPFLLPLHEAWFRVQFNRTESVITAVLLSQLLFLLGEQTIFCEKDRVFGYLQCI